MVAQKVKRFLVVLYSLVYLLLLAVVLEQNLEQTDTVRVLLGNAFQRLLSVLTGKLALSHLEIHLG